jgi:hypothetical protein
MSYGLANSINYYHRVTTTMIREVEKTKKVDPSWEGMVDRFWDACDTGNLRDIEKSHKDIKHWHRRTCAVAPSTESK